MDAIKLAFVPFCGFPRPRTDAGRGCGRYTPKLKNIET